MAQGKRDFFEWLQTKGRFLSFSPVIRALSMLCCCMPRASAHTASQLPRRPFLYQVELYSGTTSSKKASLIPKQSSEAPQCPQNNLCILGTCYILTYGLFFSFPSREVLDQVNYRRHSVSGMTENQWKKRWEIRREADSYLRTKFTDCLVQ